MTLTEAIAAELVAAREKAGLRQKDLAKRLGFAQALLSRYESGTTALSLPKLFQICLALQIKPSRFIRRVEIHMGSGTENLEGPWQRRMGANKHAEQIPAQD